MLFRPFCLILLALMPKAALAHEFWISPERYVIENGAEIQANLKVGQEFSGSNYTYNPRRFARFDIVQQDVVTPVTGRLGDTPALNMAAPKNGLAIIVHETADSTLTYTQWEKFIKFATHKDFTDVLEAHDARGLSRERFKELYRRFGKSLVAIGDGAGADREVGLRTEIVALANPYADDLSDLPVKVLLDGVPRADVQVELFERAADGTVEISLHRTNSDGIATIPLKRGHDYLVDAVAMIPLDADDPAKDPVWYSLWASLTFRFP